MLSAPGEVYRTSIMRLANSSMDIDVELAALVHVIHLSSAGVCAEETRANVCGGDESTAEVMHRRAQI